MDGVGLSAVGGRQKCHAGPKKATETEGLRGLRGNASRGRKGERDLAEVGEQPCPGLDQ